MKTQALLMTVLMLAAVGTHADAISDLAKAKCVKCHSPEAPYARIDGQETDYIFQTMKDYKSKVRQNDLMYVRASKYDEATLKGLADYFSKLTPGAGIPGDAALIAAGKEIYENGIPAAGVQSCADCHGKNAEGRGFGSGLNPRLAGQYSDFTISQMEAYKSGAIGNQPEMKAIAEKMTAEQVKAMAEYVQSL